jgi:hypothetical protein
MRTPRIGIAAFAVLALTACTGVPGGPSATPSLRQEDSPLARYLSKVMGGPGLDATRAEQQAFYDEQQRKVEEATATCMTGEGFEYQPSAGSSVVVGDAADYRPEERDWVARYGYGMVRYPGQEAESVPQATATVDPNQAYVESLTEAEQQAYQEALYGKPSEPSDNGEATEYRWQDAGCMGRAQHEVQGDATFTEETHKPLIDALTTFYSTLSDDPGYATVDAEWAACMKEGPFGGFTRQPEAAESISTLVSEYYENANAGEEGTDKTGDGSDSTFGTPDDPEYAAIAEKEVPLALADLDCRVRTNYRDRQLRIQFALEEQFIADHRAELDALVADAEQGRK